MLPAYRNWNPLTSVRLVLYMVLLFGVATTAAQADIRRLYLDILESTVDFYEPLWTDLSNTIPNSGYFNFAHYNNWRDAQYDSAVTIPGNGQVAYCYAVLLLQSDKQFFGKQQVPRSVILEHALQAVRFCCMTSSYVEGGYAYPKYVEGGRFYALPPGENGGWHRPKSRPIDVLGHLTLAAGLLRDHFDEQTWQAIEAMIIGNALKKREFAGWVHTFGGWQDRMKQDHASTVGAAFLFPQRSDRNMFAEICAGQGLDMVATEHDLACLVQAEGKTIQDWALGWNLYPDYSSDHHSWSQVWYGIDLVFEGRSYDQVLSHTTGIPVAETFIYPGNGYEGVANWAKEMCLPEGEPASVHGMEYDSYYGAGLLAYCYGAVVQQDPVAATLELQAARLLRQHTQAVKQYDYHRNSWAKAASALLWHVNDGPAVEPLPLEAAWRELEGTFHYRWQQALAQRSARKWACFGWGAMTKGSRLQNIPKGFVVPTAQVRSAAEPLIYFHPDSLNGSVRVFDANDIELKIKSPETYYTFWRNDTDFSTTGVATDAYMTQHQAFHSFADGPSILIMQASMRQDCRLEWTGLPVYFFVREGMTSPRRYTDGEGSETLGSQMQRRSFWWNVNEYIGMVVRGGNGAIRSERQDGFNWARKPEYRDKCDGVFVSPINRVDTQAGDRVIDLTAAIYVGTSDQTLKRLAAGLQDLTACLDLPAGWRGTITEDSTVSGKRYLAVSNFNGTQSRASLNLTFDEGAPVLAAESVIVDKMGNVLLKLDQLQSYSETLELYLQTTEGEPVRARRTGLGQYMIEPLQESKVVLRCSSQGAETICVSTNDGRDDVILPASKRHALTLNSTTAITLTGPGYLDATAPSAEIANISVREDGQVRVDVQAEDQSGIENVTFYCDDQMIDQRSARPFSFTHFPTGGWHTFYAVATDKSEHQNKRRSVKRTIDVIFGKARSNRNWPQN